MPARCSGILCIALVNLFLQFVNYLLETNYLTIYWTDFHYFFHQMIDE